MIDGFRFDKAFLGVVGVDMNDNSGCEHICQLMRKRKNWYSHIQKKRICYVEIGKIQSNWKLSICKD